MYHHDDNMLPGNDNSRACDRSFVIFAKGRSTLIQFRDKDCNKRTLCLWIRRYRNFLSVIFIFNTVVFNVRERKRKRKRDRENERARRRERKKGKRVTLSISVFLWEFTTLTLLIELVLVRTMMSSWWIEKPAIVCKEASMGGVIK